MKTVTGREFVDAIGKNGLPQTYSWYFESEGSDYTQKTDSPLDIKGRITSACAVGQAAVNLNIVPYPNNIPLLGRFNALMNRAIALNDDQHLPFEEIADALREEFFDLDTIEGEFTEFDYSEIVGEEV